MVKIENNQSVSDSSLAYHMDKEFFPMQDLYHNAFSMALSYPLTMLPPIFP